MGERKREVLLINTPEELKDMLDKTVIEYYTGYRFDLSFSQSVIEYIASSDFKYSIQARYIHYFTIKQQPVHVPWNILTDLTFYETLFSQLIQLSSPQDCEPIYRKFKEECEARSIYNMSRFLRYSKTITEEMISDCLASRDKVNFINSLFANPVVCKNEYFLDKIISAMFPKTEYYHTDNLARNIPFDYVIKNRDILARLSSDLSIQGIVCNTTRYVPDALLDIVVKEPLRISRGFDCYDRISCILTKEQAKKYGYELWIKGYVISDAEGPFYAPEEKINELMNGPRVDNFIYGHMPTNLLEEMLKREVMGELASDSARFLPIDFIEAHIHRVINCCAEDVALSIIKSLYNNKRWDALEKIASAHAFYLGVFIRHELNCDHELSFGYGVNDKIVDALKRFDVDRTSSNKDISALVRAIIIEGGA